MKARLIFRYLKSIFLLSILLFQAGNCWGQWQVVFEKIDHKNGLSNDRVNTIVKQENGFVWIGTTNGLNRFDGKQIKIYTKQNSSLNANDISDLFIDSRKRIWVATLGGGLNRYVQEEDRFKVYKNSPKNLSSIISNEVNVIYEDSNNNIWLGTRDGLSLFNEKENKFESYIHDTSNANSISYNDVRSIYEDVNGIFWIGTFGGGMNKFNPRSKIFERIISNLKESADFIHCINGYTENKILIGTNGGGLLEFDIKRSVYSKIIIGDKVNIIRVIYKSRDSSLLIGTDGDGMFKIEKAQFNDNQIQPFKFNAQIASSVSSNAIYEIFEDEKNSLWLGTAWNGVNVAKTKSKYEFSFENNDISDTSPVLSIFRDENEFYIGLDGDGLKVLNTESNRLNHFTKEHGDFIKGDYIQFVTKSSNDSFWFGTFVNGLVNYNKKLNSFVQYKQVKGNSESISHNDVRFVIEDEKSNLWIATWGGGINYLDVKANKFTRFQESEDASPSISSNNVISMQKDGDNLWLTTFGGGLNLFNTLTRQFKVFRYNENDLNSISSDYIYSVLKDSKDNIWIGTSGEGVNMYDKDRGRFNRFDENENIRYQTITAIIEDQNGLIWFSTKQGIFNYNYNTNSFKSFPTLIGEYHINAAVKDEEGYLYFGGSKGIIKFNPQNLGKFDSNPSVKIVGFKLFNKDVVIGKDEVLDKDISAVKNITLKHDLDVITFEFAAMKFPSSEGCEYAVKLEGFDKDWRVVGKERSTTFTNLSSGNYIFKVKSRETGSEWGEKYTSINIEILKPFWLAWWAFLVYGILVVLSFYIFRKYIIAWEGMKTNLKLEKITHEKDIELYNLKQQFFTNVSHEIRTPVTLILGAINRLLKITEFNDSKQLNPVKTLKKNSKHLLHLVNELLDFRKLEHNEIQLKVTEEDVASFCEETYLSFTELAIQKNIDFNFKTSLLEKTIWLDKNQMDKVLYNLLSNAFKFTKRGSSINFSISETNKNVFFVIKDKGVGIPNKHLAKIFSRFYQSNTTNESKGIGFGLGLSISKEIIALHHGQISVESKKGVGTTFTITLKKGNSHFKEIEIGGDELNSELIENYLIDEQNNVQEMKIKFSSDDVEKKTILIVEDNKDIQNYIVELLSDEFNILIADNGKIAIEILEFNLPDLIISDIMMPVMNGIELTRELKSNISTSHIPVLLLTARTSIMHKMEGFDIGADEYITKPFNELLLRSRINNILNNRVLLHKRYQAEELMPIGELVKNRKDQKFIESLVNIIKENIDMENLNANFISKEINMSHSVLYKKIKALTGLSLIEFVNDYKLKVAKKLLMQQQHTVAEVCYEIGYSDRKYFSKLFKKKFGKNPSEFLKYSKST